MKEKLVYLAPLADVSLTVSRQYVCASIKPIINPEPGKNQLEDLSTDKDTFSSTNIEF